MTKEEYYERLSTHDWFYYMSDDYSVYKNGRVNQSELYSIAETDDELMGMYNEWLEWCNGTYRGERPDRPTL